MNTERSVCVTLLILEKCDQTFSILVLFSSLCEYLLLGKWSVKLRASPLSIHGCKCMKGAMRFRQLRLTVYVGACTIWLCDHCHQFPPFSSLDLLKRARRAALTVVVYH